MTQDIEVRPITDDDLRQLRSMELNGGLSLRAGDALECYAFQLSPAVAIVKSVRESVFTYIALADGELIATGGCAMGSPLSGVGHPWLLTTTLAEQHKMLIARQSKRYIEFLLTRFNRLEVFVAAEYLRSQMWLEWLGFSAPGAAIPLGTGIPFVFMYLERKQ